MSGKGVASSVWLGAALTPATFMTLLLQANPAMAQTIEFRSGGAGLFIGYGGEKLFWGVEGYGTAEIDPVLCSDPPRGVLGPIGRVSFYGLSEATLTFAAFGGVSPTHLVSVAGEGGVTFALHDFDWTPHTGVWAEATAFNLFFHQEWLLHRYPFGGGVRWQPAAAPTVSCIVGRPQRDANGARVVGGPSPCGTSSLRERLVREWQKSAEEEFESVPAFLQLAAELRDAGAPEALIRRALQAAEDELRHTCLCTERVRELSGKPWLPRVPRVVRRPALSGAEAIRRLSHESWLDGCLGEGLAAALARDAADTDTDPRARGVQAAIAVDEARHAELGWDVLSWCVERDAGLLPLLRRTSVPVVTPPPAVAGNASRRRQIAEDHRAAARERLGA